MGVVQVTEKDDSASLFQRAEAALDAANRGGGNRAYYHDGMAAVPQHGGTAARPSEEAEGEPPS